MSGSTWEKLVSVSVSLFLVGCSVSEQQIEQVLEKNPDLVLKAIEKRPEQFMQVVNNVAKKAQEAERFRLEAELKAKLAAELRANQSAELKANQSAEQKAAGESKSPGRSD